MFSVRNKQERFTKYFDGFLNFLRGEGGNGPRRWYNESK